MCRSTVLVTSEAPEAAVGVRGQGDPVRGDLVVDALGRYRRPAVGLVRLEEPVDSGAVYYCRYFELAEGVDHLECTDPQPAR